MDKIYKLLRDNRQSGPYTLEELVQLGLKPFDLIWADGKTAGWMYPSEIDVFKSSVTEIKEVPVTTAEPIPVTVPATDSSLVVTSPSIAETQPIVPSSARHIFISMPAGSARVKAAPVQPTPVKEAVAVEETPEQKLERKAIELRQRVQALAEAKKTEGEEPGLDTKYSRSLDDIKEEYTHWMHEQKRKTFKLIISPKQWMAAVLVLVIAGAGYGIAKRVSSPGDNRVDLAAHQPVTTTPVTTTHSPTPEEEVAQSVINTDYTGRNAAMLDELEKANQVIEADLKRYNSKEKRRPVIEDEAVEPDIPDTYGPFEDEPADPAYESRPEKTTPASSPVVRTAAHRTEKKTVPLVQQIDVRAKYLWTSRGKGLSGLELALRNNSSQVLKTVAIDVFYYKDDRLLDKKTVYFNNVQPGQNFTLTAPGHKRASSATYQLGLISSEEGLYVAKQ